MALSNSTNFNMTVSELVRSSFRILGVGMNGETPTAEENNNAVQALNMLLKFHAKEGLKLWMTKTQSIVPVASTSLYTLGPTGTVVMPRPLHILSLYRRYIASSTDIELESLSLEDYRLITNKASVGIPTQFTYDPQITNGRLIVWPVPDSGAAALYTLELNYKKIIDDLDAVTDDIEIPQEWYLPLRWALAYELMSEFDLPPDKQNRIASKSQRLIKEVSEMDIAEETSLFLQPSNRR